MSQLQERAENDPLLAAIESWASLLTSDPYEPCPWSWLVLCCSFCRQEMVTDLLNHMFTEEKSESVIVNGLSVIQTLLEFRKIGWVSAWWLHLGGRCLMFRMFSCSPEGMQEQMTSLDAERLAQGVSNTLLSLTPRLKDFHQLLLDPPKVSWSLCAVHAVLLPMCCRLFQTFIFKLSFLFVLC